MFGSINHFNNLFFKNNSSILKAYLDYKFKNSDVSYNNLLFDYGTNTGHDCSMSNPYMIYNDICNFSNINLLPNEIADGNIITQYTLPEVNSYNPSYVLYNFTKSDTITFPYDCSAEVLIVGGGGAGGKGSNSNGFSFSGGGGGGSVGMGILFFKKNVKYNITVGDGGVSTNLFQDGKNSSIIGKDIEEIAYGGGGGIFSGGGFIQSALNILNLNNTYIANNGGSGGGAGGSCFGTPSTFLGGKSIKYPSINGIQYYGNDGGNIGYKNITSQPYEAGAGGGGAGSGVGISNGGNGTAGGDGKIWTINNKYYGGGGGGHGDRLNRGGLGGGGDGGNYTGGGTDPTPGLINTGGGGGGGGLNRSNSKPGGSGVVIIALSKNFLSNNKFMNSLYAFDLIKNINVTSNLLNNNITTLKRYIPLINYTSDNIITTDTNYLYITVPRFSSSNLQQFYFPFNVDAEVLIVGGGGAGGTYLFLTGGGINGFMGGGGGGGGVGMGSLKLYNDTYNFTIGAGGTTAGGYIDNANSTTNGGNSVITTNSNIINEIAYGGGRGGYIYRVGNAITQYNPNIGGSCGGFSNYVSTNIILTPSKGNGKLTYYGNKGGNITGGGGGALTQGSCTVDFPGSGQSGGSGITWKINTNYTYGKGGSTDGTTFTNGTNGFGEGGWGGGPTYNVKGGNGGSGNIILAISKTSFIHGISYSYSLVKRTNEYNGNCINVRRDLDNTNINIPFNNGIIDISNLETFSNNGNCYITTWYDQVGVNDLIQTNNSLQPQIVINGSVILNNDIPVVSFDGITNLISKYNVPLFNNYVVNSVLSINKDTQDGLINKPTFLCTEFDNSYPNNRNFTLNYTNDVFNQLSFNNWNSQENPVNCNIPSLENIKGNIIILTAISDFSCVYLNLKVQNKREFSVINNVSIKNNINNVMPDGTLGKVYSSKLVVGTGKLLPTDNFSGMPFYLYELNISSILDPSYSRNNFNYLNNIQIQNYIQNNTSNYLNIQPNILTTNTGLTFNFNILSYSNTINNNNINSIVFSLDTKILVPNSIFPNELLNFNIGCDISSNYLRYYVLENNNTTNVAFNSYKYVYFLSNITNDLSYNISLLSEAQTNLNLNQIQINYLSVNGDGSKIIYCDTGNNSLLYFTTYNFENKSWNPIQKTLNDIQLTSIKGLILNIDGSRGVCCFNNLFYYFTFYNNNYSILNPILDTVTTRVYNNFDITPDGNHIYASATNGIFYSSWVSTNYSIFASKVTTSPVNAVAITNNSQILAYSTSAGVFYSIGSSFSSIVTIQSFTNNIKQLKFAPYQNGLSILYAFTNNVGMYYWYVNIANNPVFSASYYSIDTTIVPQNTNYTNISINSIGSQIYYTTLDGTAIKILNIPTISSKNINSLNSLTSKRIIADDFNNYNLSINMSSDGTTFIYINNVFDVSGRLQYPSSIVRNNSYIGCNTDNCNLLNGNMKSFQMYNKKMK